MHKIYHRIDNIAGSVLNLRAEGVSYHELAEVTSRSGTSLAQVIKLDGDKVALQVFAGTRGIATDAAVRFLGRPMEVPFSDDLLGRVFTGAAQPRARTIGISPFSSERPEMSIDAPPVLNERSSISYTPSSKRVNWISAFSTVSAA